MAAGSNLGSALPGRFFLLSETSKEEKERGLSEWLCMNVLYECDYECMEKS
jgi:hypothetical protein